MNEPHLNPSRPRKTAKQERSRLLMQSVREAAVELIRQHGARQVTATGIAERAGVSVGSFYQYYPNTEAVLTDIYENILDQLNAEIEARLEAEKGGFDKTLEEALAQGIEITFSLHRELLAVDPSFYITFLNEFNITDARGPSSNSSWDEWAAGWFQQLLETHRERLRHDDIGFVARFMVDVISGAVHRFAAERPEALDDAKVKAQMLDLICRYILR